MVQEEVVQVEPLNFELSQTDFDCADVGQVIVTLTVTDGMGNTATCTAIVTVIDVRILPSHARQM